MTFEKGSCSYLRFEKNVFRTLVLGPNNVKWCFVLLISEVWRCSSFQQQNGALDAVYLGSTMKWGVCRTILRFDIQTRLVQKINKTRQKV